VGSTVAQEAFECSVPADSRIGQEEIFGPVLAVMRAPDLDAAVAISNSVDYGLSASIFTRDLGNALRFARRAEAGVVHVNSETARSHRLRSAA